ncbi:MAG: phosphoribosylformylglycinamidine synthase subunit PurQ [Planctomycetes bacterium]|nr:phosphoribosylformylglycinamidine synthase subunit PurQ [Planctomycetota bacterium]
MARPRVLVLRAPGTNCDLESCYAFERAGGEADALHVNRLLENPRVLSDYQILCFAGGFSYGDDISAGRILGSQLRLHLNEALHEFKVAEKLIIGICNGFQILMQSDLLLAEHPAADGEPEPAATLTNNDSHRYEDRWVHLGVSSDRCVFLRGIERMYLPVAHGEGRFVPRSAAIGEHLRGAGQLCLRYTAADGSPAKGFPDNPNGAWDNVAGVCDVTGRVFGLMPHPERHIERTQHPRWTRPETTQTGDGLKIFQNAVSYFG